MHHCPPLFPLRTALPNPHDSHICGGNRGRRPRRAFVFIRSVSMHSAYMHFAFGVAYMHFTFLHSAAGRFTLTRFAFLHSVSMRPAEFRLYAFCSYAFCGGVFCFSARYGLRCGAGRPLRDCPAGGRRAQSATRDTGSPTNAPAHSSAVHSPDADSAAWKIAADCSSPRTH